LSPQRPRRAAAGAAADGRVGDAAPLAALAAADAGPRRRARPAPDAAPGDEVGRDSARARMALAEAGAAQAGGAGGRLRFDGAVRACTGDVPPGAGGTRGRRPP